MPATQSSNSRRASRNHSNDEDIDARRARGEISCAECRRLKLKCDKGLPCSSCVRRGCPSICPNGSLASGQGTRFVLADTSQLHAKIAEMGQRIRQLEDALAIFQSGVSNETHPLLRDELLSIKFGPETNYLVQRENKAIQENYCNSIDALGTLTIGDRGEAKYFGRSAGSETLLLAGAELEMTCVEDDEPPALSSDVVHLSNFFPFSIDTGVEMGIDILFSSLPEQPRAWSLCETYLEHGTWSFRPITRDELINDILAPIYKSVKDRQEQDSPGPHVISAHKLAVLFIVLCLGALMDLTLEPYNAESEKYYFLSRAALSLRSIFDSPEISTVQTIILMAGYHSLGGKRYTADSTWAVMSFGAKLAQSLGLHRDSARWNMDAKTVQRRRILFYEIFCVETFYSLALGRPPSIRPSYIDCEMPAETEDVPMDENGDPRISYYQWKYNFCKNILASVLELTLTAEAPNYQTILDLDRKVREMTLPPHLNMFLNPDDESCTPSSYMKGCLLSQYRSVALLYIHRSFFAQAMLDHPVNPLRSPYAPSFLAAYRCASGVIKASLNHIDRFPELCCRWWSLWTHLFSAAIIVGCIVTRSPSSSMAPNAFIELGLACDLFEKGAKHSRRARSGAGILYRLRKKAFQTYSQFRAGNPLTPITSVGRDYGDDELALFGGQTRVLFSKLLSSRGVNRKSTGSTNSPSSTTPSPVASKSPDSEPGESPPSAESLPDVHPSLVEYISLLPPSQHPRTSPLKNERKTSVTNLQYEQHTFQPPPTSSVHVPASSAFYQADTDASPFVGLPGGPHNGSSFFNEDMISNFHGFFSEPEGDMLLPEGFQDLGNVGMMASGESGIDQQWRLFLRDSGLLDQSQAGVQL